MWDHRDDQLYAVELLAGKAWTQSINYKTAAGSFCYNDEESCATYGRLYTYAAAKQACPAGWHLPTRSEVAEVSATLVLSYGGRMKDATYDYKDLMGFLWTSTSVALDGDYPNCNSAPCQLGYVEKALSYDSSNEKKFQLDSQSKGFSVRCVQD